MSAAEIDAYRADVTERDRAALEALRRTILKIVPEAEQGLSYRVPAFRVDGKVIAGFAVFTKHLSYLPFSGSVLGALGAELDGYSMTKSALHFTADQLLPESLVKMLITARLEQLRERSGGGR